MKKFILLVLLAAFFGCKEESIIESNSIQEDLNVKVENGRLAFKSTKHYFETIADLNKMSDLAYKSWAEEHKINSLKNYFEVNQDKDIPLLHEDLRDYTNGYLSVLNENAEVKIGDTIVWYASGTKHFVPNADENLLEAIKANPSINKLTSTYSISKIDNKKRHIDQRIYPQTNSGVGTNGYQYQFTSCINTATQLKYVHELYAITDNIYNIDNGYNFHTSLFLRIKLEYYKSGKGWKAAGENRMITYYVNSSLRVFWSPPYVVSPVSGYFTNTFQSFLPNYGTNSDLIITIFDGSGQHYNGDDNPYYDVELTGYIEQSVMNAGTLCNTYRSPYAGAGTTALLW